jgi:hypothetical protein
VHSGTDTVCPCFGAALFSTASALALAVALAPLKNFYVFKILYWYRYDVVFKTISEPEPHRVAIHQNTGSNIDSVDFLQTNKKFTFPLIQNFMFVNYP